MEKQIQLSKPLLTGGSKIAATVNGGIYIYININIYMCVCVFEVGEIPVLMLKMFK
jgi:hypothetical protein